jgi:hypothetical protein
MPGSGRLSTVKTNQPIEERAVCKRDAAPSKARSAYGGDDDRSKIAHGNTQKLLKL